MLHLNLDFAPRVASLVTGVAVCSRVLGPGVPALLGRDRRRVVVRQGDVLLLRDGDLHALVGLDPDQLAAVPGMRGPRLRLGKGRVRCDGVAHLVTSYDSVGEEKRLD